MTLILGCLTHDYAVQVSDRRITLWPNYKLVDDERNKAVQFHNCFSFSFTGLGVLDGLPTAEWIIKLGIKSPSSLSSLNDFVKMVKDEATKSIASINAPTNVKRLAFTGVGFATFNIGDKQQTLPAQLVISNAWDYSNKIPFDEAQDSFKTGAYILPLQRKFMLTFPMGANLSSKEIHLLNRLIRRAIDKTSPFGIAEILCRAIRQIADRDKTVGKSLMVNILPRVAVDSPTVGHMMPFFPTRDIKFPLYFNIPANDNTATYYTPYFVSDTLLTLGGSIKLRQPIIKNS
jgi:hypothetical protein